MDEMNSPTTTGEALSISNVLKSINREANYGMGPSRNCPTLTENHVPLPISVHFDKQSPECQKWVEAHKVCGEDEYRAAKALLEITDYVSFEDFKVEFAKVLDEFNDLNRDSERQFLIVIDKGKSTEWLARLAEPRLKIKNYKMVTLQTLAAELRADPENKKIIVRMDDAAYTGNQLSEFITVMPGQRDVYVLL